MNKCSYRITEGYLPTLLGYHDQPTERLRDITFPIIYHSFKMPLRNYKSCTLHIKRLKLFLKDMHRYPKLKPEVYKCL